MRLWAALLAVLLLSASVPVSAGDYSCSNLFTVDGNPVPERVLRELVVVLGEGEEARVVRCWEPLNLSEIGHGAYTVTAYYRGVLVGRGVVYFSRQGILNPVELALRSFSIRFLDLEGRPLENVEVEVLPRVYSGVRVAGDRVVVEDAVSTLNYLIEARWRGGYRGGEAVGRVSALPSLLKEVTLPVGDVVVEVLDMEGKPLPGAVVELGGVRVVADAWGRAVFERVPLGDEGLGIDYETRLTYGGSIVYQGLLRPSSASRSFTVVANLGRSRVRVLGALGQPLPHAIVEVDGLGTYSTGADGVAEIGYIPGGEYNLSLRWRGFQAERTLKIGGVGGLYEVRLPVYMVLMGLALTWEELLVVIGSGISGLIALLILALEILLQGSRKPSNPGSSEFTHRH